MQISTHKGTQAELERLKAIDTLVLGMDYVSEPNVMASAAGWYVGKLCLDSDMDYMIVPWSRESLYMTEEEAIALWESDYADDE